MNRFSDRLITFLVSGTIIVIILSALSSGGMKRSDTLSTHRIPASIRLRSGDLIFRDGRGMISHAFRRASLKKPLYSHAGIIHWNKDQCMVIHIIDDQNDRRKVRLDPVRKFCDPAQCSSYAIYRTRLPGADIDKNAISFFRSGVAFDNLFDLASEDKMYCTELVYKALLKSSSTFSIPLNTISGKTYVACDDLFMAPGNRLIYSQTY